MKKTLLVLAFEFPPLSGIGVQRSLKLAKYLPEHGVRPVVVTTDATSFGAWFNRALEPDPLAELPPEVVVHRVPCPRRPIPAGLWARRVRRLFSVGEEDIGRQWEPHLARVWDRIVEETRPEAIYVSIPPFSIAPLAAKLARRSGLPLIVDFRDSWSQWCHGPQPSWLHYKLTVGRERACLEEARTVIGTTRQIIRDLQAVHPQVAREKFHVIPNGYDGGLAAPVARAAGADPFVIGYVGSFYYLPQMRASVMEPWWRLPPRHWLHYSPRREDWLYRTPFFFFRSLKMMLDSRPDLRRVVKVRFVGDREDWLVGQVEQFGLQDVVEHMGRLAHPASLAFQAGCDALLATSAKAIGGRGYPIAGKTFEYIATGRPIVAFVTEGEQRDFLQESGMAALCDPDDPETSARVLEKLVTGGFAAEPNLAFLQRFHRWETSRQLADLLAGPG